MAIPPFGEAGDLPPGVHRAALREVLDRVGTHTPRRRMLARRPENLHRLAFGTGHPARFVVFGSVVTAKPQPNDVDVFVLTDDSLDVTQVTGEAAVILDHAAAQNLRGCGQLLAAATGRA